MARLNRRNHSFFGGLLAGALIFCGPAGAVPQQPAADRPPPAPASPAELPAPATAIPVASPISTQPLPTGAAGGAPETTPGPAGGNAIPLALGIAVGALLAAGVLRALSRRAARQVP
jgi:hypothetical protein